MPIQDVRHIEDNARLGRWQLQESIEELLAAYNYTNRSELPAHITHEHKQKEWLAQRLLLAHMEGEDTGIKHAASGAPYLEGATRINQQISISHCSNTIALLINDGPFCGVDIASIDDRATRIRKRFLSHEEQLRFEQNDETDSTLWACKEAAFKAYNQANIIFSEDILVEELAADHGLIKLKKKDNAILKFGIERQSSYVLVYTLNQ